MKVHKRRPPRSHHGSIQFPVMLSSREISALAAPDPFAEKIKHVVESAVKQCGTQAALARHLAVSPAIVCQWRKGRKHPNRVHLMKMQELG